MRTTDDLQKEPSEAGVAMIRALALALLALSAWGCRWSDRGASRPAVDAGAREAAASPERAPDAAGDREPPRESSRRCIHQRRLDLAAPVHREAGGRGGFVRLDECTRVTVIEGNERWARITFPLTDGRTEGWVSRRYLMDCGACAPPADAGPGAGGSEWPPRPVGRCLDHGATGREQLVMSDALDRAVYGGGAKGLPGTRVVVASYNLWELYDGEGGDRYLSPLHDGTPQGQYRSRLVRFGQRLAPRQVDVLLLQEVESARVACAIVEQAWPRSGWTCAATKRAGASPMNLAIATRLRGTIRHLAPRDRATTGPRGALELSLEGAGGLTVTTVHLKSSRGALPPEDCANARQRMGAAAALAARYDGWSSVLIMGDFNVDPMDPERAIYDRTDDVLASRRFERLCSRTGCSSPTYLAPRSSARGGAAIDLAFFRAGGVWRFERFDVIGEPARGSTAPRLSDHRPVVVELRRD